MVDADDDAPDARPPTLSDLIYICRRLNEEGASYVVIGGMAVIQTGFVRATEDIDLLVDPSPSNMERVQRALESMPDGAARDLRLDDVEKYTVVRVADEVVVDLLGSACGVTYAEARSEMQPVLIEGVTIPFAMPALLLRTKQTIREKDCLDRIFLERLLAEKC